MSASRPSFYRFIAGLIPLGDNNLAQAKTLGPLPGYDPQGHFQYRYRHPLRVTSPPQLFVNQSWTTAGVGGLVSGGIVFQSLTPNPNPGQ
jgi:hypothetical protein